MEAAWNSGDGPVVKFDKGSLKRCKDAGNAWYQNNFRLPLEKWTSYFMYALERYAWFKEQAEGNVGGALSNWYDVGVDYIIEYQRDDGSIVGHKRVPTMPLSVNTSLSLLFLVRASEVISLPPVSTSMIGGQDIASGALTQGKEWTHRFIRSRKEPERYDQHTFRQES